MNSMTWGSYVIFWELKSIKMENGYLFHRRYDEKILKNFRMFGCKPIAIPLIGNEKLMKEDGRKKVDVALYRSPAGKLLYFTAWRPDFIFVASTLSRFMHSPRDIHFAAAKSVLRYIQGTRS